MKYNRLLISLLCLLLVTSAIAGDFGVPGQRIDTGTLVKSGKEGQQTAISRNLFLNNSAGAKLTFSANGPFGGNQTIGTGLSGEKIQLYPSAIPGQYNSSDTALGLDSAKDPIFLTNGGKLLLQGSSNTIEFDTNHNFNGNVVPGIFSNGGGIGVLWASGDDTTESYNPVMTLADTDQPGVLADTSETFDSFYTAGTKIYLLYFKLIVENAAGSCTTAPVYRLEGGTTYGTSTSIQASCSFTTTQETTANTTKDCGLSQQGVTTNTWVWVDVTTAASVCAVKNKLLVIYAPA